MESEAPQKSSKGYGKRSVWYWVLIYAVAAGVIYGLVYWFFMRDSGGTGSTGGGSFGY